MNTDLVYLRSGKDSITNVGAASDLEADISHIKYSEFCNQKKLFWDPDKMADIGESGQIGGF